MVLSVPDPTVLRRNGRRTRSPLQRAVHTRRVATLHLRRPACGPSRWEHPPGVRETRFGFLRRSRACPPSTSTRRTLYARSPQHHPSVSAPPRTTVYRTLYLTNARPRLVRPQPHEHLALSREPRREREPRPDQRLQKYVPCGRRVYLMMMRTISPRASLKNGQLARDHRVHLPRVRIRKDAFADIILCESNVSVVGS